MENELIIYFSKNRFNYLFPKLVPILALLVVTIFISIATITFSIFLLIIVIILIVLILVIFYSFYNFFYNIKHKIPMLIFNDKGIYSYGLLKNSFFINWEHIDKIFFNDINISNVQFNNMLIIKLKKNYQKKNPIYRFNLYKSGGEYLFPDYLFENNFSKLFSIIRKNSIKYNFFFDSK